MTQETKPVPAIAIRCLKIMAATQQAAMDKAIIEAADAAGVDLADGWTITPDGTTFVREVNDVPSIPRKEA